MPDPRESEGRRAGTRAASDHYAPEKHSTTIVPIARAASRRYDRLQDMLLAVAARDFEAGRHAHCRYWLTYLREARGVGR